MNIIEVKNNLVKLAYEEDLTLGSFIKISDIRNSYIAQILHLETSRIGNTAIARLIFNYKCGIQAYDGSVPAIQAEIEILNDDFFPSILEKTDPLLVGKLAQKDADVIVSANLLKDKPIICAEKSYQYTLLIKNLIKQNELNNRKTVIFDTTGELNNGIIATKNFKIPLDKNSIDYIFDRGFDDLTKENKAFIQDIFSELNEYIKTVEYIPFNDFNAVIDYEFKRTQKLQLIILKNRLTQFEKLGIFAQEAKDFKILDEKLSSDNTIIIDLSRLTDALQTEYITYIYSRMEAQNTNFYSIVSLNNLNSTKSTLNTLFGTKNVFTSIACPYSYKFIDDLKQCSKNMFMFTPLKQQNDFGAYNIFLNKLAEDEFILYGKTTKFTPLIIKLEEINDFSTIEPSKDNETITDAINIQQDFNNILPISEEEPIVVDEQPEEMPQTENIINSDIEEEPTIQLENNQELVEEESVMEIPQEDEVVPQIIEQEEESPVIEEEPVMEIPQEENIVPQIVIEEEPVKEQENIIEEEPVMEVPQEDNIIPEITSDEQAVTSEQIEEELSQVSIDIADDDIAEAIQSEPIEEKQSLDPSELFRDKSQDEQINDNENTDLTDADLDMIESLQLNDSTTETIPNLEESPIEETLVEEISETIEEEPIMEIPQEDQNTKEEPQEKQPSITEQILMEDAQRKAEEEANKPDPIEEQIEKPQQQPPKVDDKLETRTSQTPIVPVYSAEIPEEDIVESDEIKQGDTIMHAEFGRGIVEKIINYGDRNLCSVNFEQVGRRLLDPKISEMKKIN